MYVCVCVVVWLCLLRKAVLYYSVCVCVCVCVRAALVRFPTSQLLLKEVGASVGFRVWLVQHQLLGHKDTGLFVGVLLQLNLVSLLIRCTKATYPWWIFL